MKKLYIVLFAFIGLTATTTTAQDYKDVAHIFYSRCTSCHHLNQHAPPMMNYSQTMNLAYALSADLTGNRMPPWPPDTLYSRFTHEHIITASEKADLLSWINQGFTMGDTTLAPTPPTYQQYQLNGTPDLILSTGAFASNATLTADAYDCFSLPSGLLQDRILRAYEIVPGNVPIVHHVVVNLDSMATTTSNTAGNCWTITGDIGIGGYAPGSPPTVFPGQAPLKAGIRIKAGSKLVLQIHYPAGTGGQMDNTQIRLYFYPIGTTGVRTIYNSVPLQLWSLPIPANTTQTFTQNYALSGDISLFAVFPHSHKICTKITNYAFLGTDTIKEIKIDNWRFDWQGYYTFPNLKKIPNNYTLHSMHFYDNTTNNLNNPHNPPQNVQAGTSTTDEMFFDAIQWLVYQPGDENIDVASILANDPLLANVNDLATSSFQSYVYPNPANDKVNIYLSKKADYKIGIYTIAGQNVLQTKTSEDATALDVKNIANGLYLVEIKDIKSGETISKKIIILH